MLENGAHIQPETLIPSAAKWGSPTCPAILREDDGTGPKFGSRWSFISHIWKPWLSCMARQWLTLQNLPLGRAKLPPSQRQGYMPFDTVRSRQPSTMAKWEGKHFRYDYTSILSNRPLISQKWSHSARMNKVIAFLLKIATSKNSAKMGNLLNHYENKFLTREIWWYGLVIMGQIYSDTKSIQRGIVHASTRNCHFCPKSGCYLYLQEVQYYTYP